MTAATITQHITQQLSKLPGLAIGQIHSVDPKEDPPGALLKITVMDQGQNRHPLILKRQDNDVAYRLYQQYLVPYHLNSPKEYGYIELEGQRFLVMDYVEHLPADWEDSRGFMRAVNWLIKKDLISWQHLDAIQKLDCLGKMDYYGVDYWLPIFEQWYLESTHNRQAEQVWRCVDAHQNRIHAYIDELSQVGVQTVVHGDLQLDNILFATDATDSEFFVIDWTQPHIGSVAKDLVSLYDNAPGNVKSALIETYRKHIDFPHFDEIFAKAYVLRDIGYLSWMAWMINIGQKEDIAQQELDRVTASLLRSLDFCRS